MQRTDIVIGIGNPVMGDDRAGLDVARLVEDSGAEADVASFYTVGFALMDALRGRTRAFIVDASRLGQAPGTVREIAADQLSGAAGPVNSHAIQLGQTLETAALLYPDEMPRDVRIILIEAAKSETPQTPCTPEVAEAVQRVAEDLAARLKRG